MGKLLYSSPVASVRTKNIQSQYFPLGRSTRQGLNKAAYEYSLQHLPFKMTNHGLTYLGIKVTAKFNDLLKANFMSLLAQTQKDFTRWSVLNLSLAARINLIKMNTLPKFLYLFQYVPIFLPQIFFQKLDSIVSDFIWSNKTPRIRKQLLQMPKELGGMALPNFRYYYWAANIRILQYWLQYEIWNTPPAWLEIEALSSQRVSLSALAHSPVKCPPSTHTKNIIVKTSWRIWSQFRRHFGLQTYSTLAPLASNHTFPPSLQDGAFNNWANLEIRSIKDLFINDTFASFQQLSDKFALPKHNFFRFCRFGTLLKTCFLSFLVCQLTHNWTRFLNPYPL